MKKKYKPGFYYEVGNYDPTVKLDKKPLDIAFEKLDNELVRRPLKTYSPASLLLDAFKETK